MQVEVVKSLQALAAIAPAWRALDEQTFPRLPFTAPRWNLIWWKHFAESRRMVADRLHTFVLFDDNQLLAVVPMMFTERPSVGPLRARQLQFFGADPNLTEVRGPCCRREDEGRVFEALLSHLEARANEWDWVELSGFLEQGPAFRSLAQRKVLGYIRQMPNFFIQPGNNWEAYKAALPRNVRESLRKCYATLRRDNLRHEMRIADQPSVVNDALETFLELHSARAQAPITPQHPDVFATRPSRNFLREYMIDAAAAGSAKLFELLVEGEVVASRIGFVLDDSLYLYYSGYKPTMARYSVMTTCTMEAIKWAIDKGLKTINLSTGRDQSKLRWRPIELPLVESQWVSPSWRGRSFHRLGRAVKRQAIDVPAVGGLRSLAKMMKRQPE